MSASVSLVSTLPLTGFGAVSSVIALLSATATGVSLTGVTVRLTVAVVVPPAPSVMV